MRQGSVTFSGKSSVPVAAGSLERFRKFGANCVCVHQSPDATRRSFVAQDLLDAHSTHCNYPERAANIFSYLGQAG